MRRLLSFGILLLVFQLFAYAQTYRNITTVDGLTNNYVYSIARDKEGFTWFLTSSGVDRFDGLDFIHFSLHTDYRPIGVSSQYQLATDKNGDIWEIGTRKGNCICHFNKDKGYFTYIPIYGIENNGIHLLFLDSHNRFWLSSDNKVFIYNIETGIQEEVEYSFPFEVTCGAELQNGDYIIGMEKGLINLNYSEEKWNIKNLKGSIEWKKYHNLHINERISKKFIPTCISQISAKKISSLTDDKNNIILFDSKSHFYKINTEKDKCEAYVIQSIHDTHITDVKPYFNNPEKWLVSTEGKGVFLLNSTNCTVSKYVCFDFDDNPGLRGNVTLNVLTEENGKRVWFANYPYGICCHNIHFPSFTQYKNTNNNEYSISPGVVTEITQDYEGDIWYATSSGISCHILKSNTWKHYLRDQKKENLTYLAVCEIRPGLIMASGLMSGGFIIDKNSGKEISINPLYFGSESDADYNVRDIYKDDNGIIWLAGNDYLGRIDWDNKKYTTYPLKNPAMLLKRKDKNSFWLVTVENVYSINIHTAEKTIFNLPDECIDINDIVTNEDGTVYVATADEGLFVFNKTQSEDSYKIKQFNLKNSSLLTNNIIAITLDSENNLLMSTDIGVTKYYTKKNTFVNWTHLQGIPALGFYKKSILNTKDKKVLYGTYDGVISIEDSVRLPIATSSKTILSNLHINNKPRYIRNNFKHLELKQNERQIAMKVSCLNYDNPYTYVYSWKLESKNRVVKNGISKDRNIRFLLKPGEYKLTIYTYNSTEYKIVDERHVTINIKPSMLQATMSIILYLGAFILIIFCIHIFFLYRNKRLVAEEKVNFFIRTAHDIRTPLSLIKAPLEEISNNEKLSKRGYSNIKTVIRSANDLLIMTGDLLNIERIKIQSTKLKLYLTDISTYLQELIIPFQLYASTKKLQLIYKSTMKSKVWIDRSRMDCIIQNLINNAIKYTPTDGTIIVSSNINEKDWCLSIMDTGIGIPENEQKKLTEIFYRSSNTESKTDGAGIGLYLVKKLVEEHKGKIIMESKENEGTTFTLYFPLEYDKDKNIIYKTENKNIRINVNLPKILVVEDNSELRHFLKQSLSDFFVVTTAENGDEAYNKIRFIHPDIVISDIMMPGMRGDFLCKKIKSDIETSHIPVILLTARVDKNSHKEALAALADAYITKPFSIDILKANIDNILANRKIQQRIFNNIDETQTSEENVKTNDIESEFNDIDVDFIQSINKIINDHLNDNGLNVDTLCTFIGMSRTSLYNKLKSLTNYSPADYIRMHRIEKSKLMLQKSKFNINEISERCGFGDAKYFREVFKKNTGMSPSQYRNNFK